MKLIKQNFNNEEKFKMFYFFIRERKFYGQVSDAVSNKDFLNTNSNDVNNKQLSFQKKHISMYITCNKYTNMCCC